MKKTTLLLLTLLISFSTFSQVYYMEITLEDFDLKGNISAVYSKEISLKQDGDNNTISSLQTTNRGNSYEYLEFNEYGLLTKNREFLLGRNIQTDLTYSDTGKMEGFTVYETLDNGEFKRYVKAEIANFDEPNFTAEATITDVKRTDTKIIHSNKEDYQNYFKEFVDESSSEKNKQGLYTKQILNDKVYTYEYTYDQHGNWIIMTTYENNIPSKVTIRKIKYAN